MCGIAGVIHRGGTAAPELLGRMVSSMHLRGPDGEGRFADGPVEIGMRRLAIIDPKHGEQPFETEDGRFVAMLNGEIYNHWALRRDLAGRGVRFQTDCDAEVLPHAFREWGPEEFPRRLDGMFGIVILDRQDRVLHLYRDRYGEKPVFYSDGRERFAFASQLVSMTLDPSFDFETDRVALRHYLFLHYVPGSRTIFESVRRLEPGCRLSVHWDRTEPPEISDWSAGFEEPARPLLYGSAVRATRRRVEEAVRSRLIADVPVGIFLSGGLDSSVIAAAAARNVSRIQTFSVGFEDSELDESLYARAVAEHLGADHHHFQFDLAACLSVLDDAMCVLDEPIGDPACLPVLLLSKEARRHVKVVLTGEGADEFFGGYSYYPGASDAGVGEAGFVRHNRRCRSLLARTFARGAANARRSDCGRVTSFFRGDNSTPSGFPGLTNPGERDRLVPGAQSDDDSWSRTLAERIARIPCALERAQTADIRSWLDGDLLPKLDHMTMAASLEGRAPYLDPKVAEFALSMPAGWKVDQSGRKRVLRDAFAGWLPEPVLGRKKQGFVLPIQKWLLGPLKERLLDGLAEERGDGLDAAVARRIVLDDLEVGAPRARLLYGLLVYRDWMLAVREGRARAIQLAEGRRM
ncbi:MAG: asparagine synthase (glutamine-hydrolyzing) [Deltaproteobacteria bacterium]|nr:asparagine synthase (glutamine-hydrolyzing) [Deltaproteobacteria bacterium]